MNDYEKQIGVANSIRDGLAKREAYWSKSSCDKRGWGINKDSRFSSVKMEVSIDTWAGWYGDSGCSNILHISDANIFKSAFFKVIERNLDKLLLDTASLIEKESEAAKMKLIAELEDKLEQLKNPKPQE